MNRVLLIEDHDRLAKLIMRQLNTSGIAVDVFERIETAWLALQQIHYQAIILDRGLPDGDGLILLKRIRTCGINIPCLILTARDALHDRIEGLDSGADDYLIKPFAMDEMIARVRALLRRPTESINLQPMFKDLQIKPELGVMCCGEKNILLAPAELQVMLLFVSKRGDVVRRSAMEAAGWGVCETVTPNALDVLLYRLRKKLKSINSTVEIVNVRGLGYALRS